MQMGDGTHSKSMINVKAVDVPICFMLQCHEIVVTKQYRFRALSCGMFWSQALVSNKVR